jgi:hypothetical protein
MIRIESHRAINVGLDELTAPVVLAGDKRHAPADGIQTLF